MHTTTATSNWRALLRALYPFLIVIAVLWVMPRNARAQPHRPVDVGTPPSKPYQPQAPDNQLKQLLPQIDQNQLQATIQKLVSFGTRHTASSQTDPVRGIGAATDWVFQQLQTYAASSGGNLTVQKQTFVQPVTVFIPVPTTITNVIATLKGSFSPDRTYLGLPAAFPKGHQGV